MTASADGARVLIVEDEPHIRDLVALHLRLEGLAIVAVGDGNEGAAACAGRSRSTSSCST